MNRLSLSSVLLFPLAIFFIMQYRISPGETPYALFGVIFALLLGFVIVDLISLPKKIYAYVKQILLGVIVILVIGSAFFSAIVVRHQTSPIYNIHDIILQQEAAIRFFIHGKNPYATSYFGTPLEQWNYSDKDVNPALYHFVMEPFYLIFALPFYFLMTRTAGFFDARIPLVFLFAVLLILASRVVKDTEKKLLFIILLAFNPATLGYLLEGRSDIFMYTFLFAGFYLLSIKRFAWAGVLIALSFCIKQSAWLVFPFYASYLFFVLGSWKKVLQNMTPFLVIFAGIVLPFYFWNPKAFFDSTVLYLSGDTMHSYPISGYGFGMVLNQIGVISNVHQYFPFTIIQIIIGVPVLVSLLLFLRKRPSVDRLILVYGIFLFVYWYFSRYFNNSHLGYLSMIFITAYFWLSEEKKGLS